MSHVAMLGGIHVTLMPPVDYLAAEVTAEAIRAVIVDNANRLHPGVNDSWSDKLEPAALHLLGDLL